MNINAMRQAELQPLSEHLGLQSPSQVVGQPNRCIWWGLRVAGRTSIARLMASSLDAHFITISAVFDDIKDILGVVKHANLWRGQGGGKPAIVWVNEVQRFNKAVKSSVNQLVNRYLCDEFVQLGQPGGVKAHG